VLEPPPELRASEEEKAPAPPRAETASEDAASRPAAAAGAAPGARPRQVPTRDILRALVHLLIERELISREELLRAVQEVAEDAPGR
jgi:hypothetical protein